MSISIASGSGVGVGTEVEEVEGGREVGVMLEELDLNQPEKSSQCFFILYKQPSMLMAR